jgi:hypothetical protein
VSRSDHQPQEMRDDNADESHHATCCSVPRSWWQIGS